MSSKATGGTDSVTLYQAPGCLFASWKNVLVATWATQVTLALADELDRVTDRFSKAHPEGFSAVHVGTKGPPLPTAAVREKLISSTRKYSTNLACAGTVLEGSGFWASAVRSFIVGIRLVVPRTFDMQTYASIGELVAWMTPLHVAKTGVAVDPAEFERALVALRLRID